MAHTNIEVIPEDCMVSYTNREGNVEWFCQDSVLGTLS